MKIFFIIVITALVSSAGTYFYTTKKMAPEFYRKTVSTANEYLRMFDNPKEYCPQPANKYASPGRAAASEKPNLGNFGDLMRQAQEARKEHNRILKEMEKSP